MGVSLSYFNRANTEQTYENFMTVPSRQGMNKSKRLTYNSAYGRS